MTILQFPGQPHSFVIQPRRTRKSLLGRALQLRIELLGIQPPIWRRILIPAHYRFWDLHVAIQSAFGWNDSHLHEFRVVEAGRATPWLFGIPLPDHLTSAPEHRPQPGWLHQVADHLHVDNPVMDYVYDFGDHWQHRIQFEDEIKRIPGKRYPRCEDGARAAPPDDCGGASGYESLIEILRDPRHPEYRDMQRWAMSIKQQRVPFDPEAFDPERVRFSPPGARLNRLFAGMRA